MKTTKECVPKKPRGKKSEKVTKNAKNPVTKKRLVEAEERKIPESILKHILEEVEKDNLFKDRNKSCLPAIHTHGNIALHKSRHSAHQIIKHARTCLLRRDWINLARLLRLNTDTGYNIHLATKYLAIALAHNDEELLQVFLQTVYNYEGNARKLLKSCAKLN